MIAVDLQVEAARIHGRGDIRVAMEPASAPEAGEVPIRVSAVGLCGSDLHWYQEASIGDARLSRPLILGHEFAGVIAAGPRAGQRVVVDPADPCGRCEQCLEGNQHLCPAMRFAGHGTADGAMRSLMPWPERLLHPLPDYIGDEEAVLLEPLGVALHALDLAPIGAGRRAGVYGCGPIGLLLVQLLRLRGLATVVATDRLEHRVVAAREMGATDAYVVDEASGPKMSPGRLSARDLGVDVAFEASGSDAALSDALAAVRPGGRVVVVGIPEGDRTVFEAGVARRKELMLSLCRRMVASDMARAIDLVAAGHVRLAPLITHRFPLAEAPEAFAALADRRGIKVIVSPSSQSSTSSQSTRESVGGKS